MSFHEEPHTPQLWRKLFFFFCFSPAIRVVCCLCVGCFDLALFFCWKTKENRWKRCRPARSCGSATVTRRKRSGRCVFAASPSTTAAKKKKQKKVKKETKKKKPKMPQKGCGFRLAMVDNILGKSNLLLSKFIKWSVVVSSTKCWGGCRILVDF